MSTNATVRKARRRSSTPATNTYVALRAVTLFILGMTLLSIARTAAHTNDLTSTSTMAAAFGLAVPIGLAGLGGLWSERAGIVNIGLEGMMILGTFGAGWAGFQWGAWAGLLAAVVFGAFGAFIFAVVTITFGVDQIIAGTAINILGLGLTQFLAKQIFANAIGGGQSQSPPVKGSLPTFSLSVISEPLTRLQHKGWFFISDVAGLVSGFFYQLSILTVITVLLFVITGWVLWRTAFGLRLRSAGENPWAAESLGVNVYRYKYLAVIISGGLSGLAGAYLAIVGTNVYRGGQTAGRGYIGLATMIFGNWRPAGTGVGAIIFGYIDTLQLRDNANIRGLVLFGACVLIVLGLLGMRRAQRGSAIAFLVMGVALVGGFFASNHMPPEVAQVAPYVTTLLVLATAAQRLRPPTADGVIYRRGESH